MDLPPTSKTLLFRIRNSGDDDAWRTFAEVYSPLLFRFFRGRGLGEADAADVLQVVLVAVAQAIRKFEYDRSKGTFRSWLYTVARSKLNTHFAKAAKRPIPMGQSEVARMSDSREGDHGEEVAWEMEYRRRVFEWACERVRGEFQGPTWEAFWLTAVVGEPAAAAAERLGMSPGSVYTARSRVNARLMREIAEHLAEDFEPPRPE